MLTSVLCVHCVPCKLMGGTHRPLQVRALTDEVSLKVPHLRRMKAYNSAKSGRLVFCMKGTRATNFPWTSGDSVRLPRFRDKFVYRCASLNVTGHVVKNNSFCLVHPARTSGAPNRADINRTCSSPRDSDEKTKATHIEFLQDEKPIGTTRISKPYLDLTVPKTSVALGFGIGKTSLSGHPRPKRKTSDSAH